MLSTVLLYILMLIIPSVMLIYGLSSWYSALNNKSSMLISYRSKKARKDNQTWIKANLFFGKVMSGLGFLMFIVVIGVLWYLGTIQALSGFAETVMLLLEVIVFLGVFYLTEIMLGKTSKEENDGK